VICTLVIVAVLAEPTDVVEKGVPPATIHV